MSFLSVEITNSLFNIVLATYTIIAAATKLFSVLFYFFCSLAGTNRYYDSYRTVDQRSENRDQRKKEYRRAQSTLYRLEEHLVTGRGRAVRVIKMALL